MRHPSGTVFFNDHVAIDAEIAEMMTEVRNIEAHMQPVILELYQRFLLDSADPEEREYADAADEIMANFVHANYVSAADLVFCRGFDVDSLSDNPGFEEMQALHAALAATYPDEGDEAA